MSRDNEVPTITEQMARERIEFDPNRLLIQICGVTRLLVRYHGEGILSIVAIIKEDVMRPIDERREDLQAKVDELKRRTQ